MPRLGSALSLLLLLLLSSPALARYANVETALVPVARLVDNLTAQVERSPEDVQLWHALARVHAMAYSSKQDELTTRLAGTAGRQLWFGHAPPHVPFREVREAKDADAGARAAEHLEQALRCYERARALAPDDLTIALGQAWCLEQHGDDVQARERYREVVRRGWAQEEKQERGLGHFVTVEAAGYLIPLLDPEKDAAELADLRAKVEHLEALPRMFTPLAIPLEPGLEPAQLLDRERPVAFDLDGSGRRQRWSWITPRAAWLVWDPARQGRIDSAIWLFGSRTFQLFCRDGFEALALLDDDHDGQLRGAELSGLSLWHDIDGDGVSDPGEVQPLEAWGITGLSCRGEQHPSGILYAPGGVLYADGTRRPCFDLLLERHPSDR